MLRVFVKGLNKKGYVCGFAFQPVVREAMVPTNLGDMKGLPDLSAGGVQFKKVQQQVLVPVAFIVMEDEQMVIGALDGLVPLLSKREKAELAGMEVPPEAIEEAAKLKALQQHEDATQKQEQSG